MSDDEKLLAWLLRLPAVKAQAYFWNHSSRTERKKAMRDDMAKDVPYPQFCMHPDKCAGHSNCQRDPCCAD